MNHDIPQQVRHETFEKRRGETAGARPGRWLLTTSILLAAAALGGCGNLTAGGASEVEVVVASDGSDAESGSAGAQVVPPPTGAGAFLRSVDPFALQGTLRADVSVRLVDADGHGIDLTAGIQEVLVSLTGGSRATATLTNVPAGDYHMIEAGFHRVAVEVVSGPGITLPVEFELDLSDGPHEIESAGSLVLGPDERVRIVLDMKVGRWVLTPAGERTSRFRDAVTLSVEPAD